MAENDDQERTEQPSEKRLREAREKGDVPRSRDLSGAMVVLAGASALLADGDALYAHLQRICMLGLSYRREALFTDALPTRALLGAFHEALALFAPVGAATLLAALAAPTLLGGLSFSGEALIPKLERLDPIAGIGRLFSLRGLVELGKSLLKLLVIGGALILVLRSWQGEMVQTGRLAVGAGIGHALALLGRAALVFGAMLALIGGLDALWQRFDYSRRLRMTRQEVRDEHKESDGSPEIKGRIRQLQVQLSRRRMMQELPKADVVVVNPSHFAVALRYDDGNMRAPRVVAKGVDLVAMQIRMVADAHRIPLVEAPPLARALYATTQLGKEIPSALYVAVAQVLAYVYQLKQATARGDAPPPPPRPEIDPELQGRYRETQAGPQPGTGETWP